jgi:hypothetical protein
MSEVLGAFFAGYMFSSWKAVLIVVVFLVVAWYLWAWWADYRKQRCRAQIDARCRTIPAQDTIFVSIASYRDPQCAHTIHDLFEKAYCPFRIFVGVCQQNQLLVDEDVMVGYKNLCNKSLGDFSGQIRVHCINAGEAKGPMYARHLIEKNLFRGERFYLVTDSHMLFTPHWDQRLIEEWEACRRYSLKPILTTYPDDFKPIHRSFPPPNYDRAVGSYLRFKKFNPDTGLVEIEGPQMVRQPAAPVPGLFWAACMSFGLSSQVGEVPFDPHCDYVFLGEEIAMAARLWTSGYDFYHPTKMYVYHMWERMRPVFWQQLEDPAQGSRRRQMERDGYQRLKTLLQMSGNGSAIVPPYGLGTVRSIKQFEDRIGIRLNNQQLVSLAPVLGVPDQAPAQEILCRFGTWSQFAKAKQALTTMFFQ